MAGGDPASISGDAPWFYNATTKQFATYDPSAFAGELDELGDMTSLLSRVGEDALGRNGDWVAGICDKLSRAGDGVLTQGRDIQ